MKSPVRRLWSALFLFLFLILIPLSSSLSAQAGPEAFSESIDVRVVNVEAVVTARNGGRVRGLTAADFRLLVDGEEVPIGYFTEVVDGAAAPQPAEAGAAGPAVPAPVQGTVGRNVLVFIDQAFSLQPQLALVLRRLQQDLGRLGAEDRVAVVSFDGHRLSIVSDWTGDLLAVRGALARAAEGATGGAAVRAERASLRNDQDLRRKAAEVTGILGDDPRIADVLTDPDDLPSLLTGPTGSGRSFLTANSRDFAGVPWQAVAKARKTMTAAVAAMRGLAAEPGRKTVLLLSGGWPVELQPRLFPELVDTANRLGYTLYPVDVAGIETSPVPFDASTPGPTEPGLPNTRLISSRWEQDVHYGKELLARWTGGKVSLNSNREVALGRLVEDTNAYYWIGFSPAWRGDGRRHAVKLEARRPGLAVRARRSFTDLSRAAEGALSLEGEMMLGRQVVEKQLAVELGAVRRAGLSAVEVPLTLGVPAAALAFVQAGDVLRADLPLQVVSFDDSNEALDLPAVILHAEVKEVPPPGTLVRFASTLRLRRGERRLRFIVQDAIHDKLLWGQAEVAH